MTAQVLAALQAWAQSQKQAGTNAAALPVNLALEAIGFMPQDGGLRSFDAAAEYSKQVSLPGWRFHGTCEVFEAALKVIKRMTCGDLCLASLRRIRLGTAFRAANGRQLAYFVQTPGPQGQTNAGQHKISIVYTRFCCHDIQLDHACLTWRCIE